MSAIEQEWQEYRAFLLENSPDEVAPGRPADPEIRDAKLDLLRSHFVAGYTSGLTRFLVWMAEFGTKEAYRLATEAIDTEIDRARQREKVRRG